MDQELSASEMLDSVRNESSGEPAADSTATPAAAPQGPWWSEKLKESVEYDADGKKVSEPLEMVFKRAGMGYHYAQKMHALNQSLEKLKGYDELESKYKGLSRWQEYDDYARQNPEWAKHVEENWANKEKVLQSNPELAQYQQKIQSLEEKLSTYDEKFSSWEQAQQAEKFKAEDTQFNDEIQSVAKQFGVELSQADEQGQSLEWRVLQHMTTLGLDGSKKGHFTAAFKDYYFDNLVGKTKEQAVENHAKSQAELRKQGIREITRAPKQEGLNGYRPGMSKEDVDREALAYYQSLKKA